MFKLFKREEVKTIQVYAVVNGKQEAKKFNDKSKAIKYISDVLLLNDLEVSEIIARTNSEEYYCNDKSRFFLVTE